MAFGNKLKADTAEKKEYLAGVKRAKTAGRRPSKYGTYVKVRRNKKAGSKAKMNAMSKQGMSYDQIAKFSPPIK